MNSRARLFIVLAIAQLLILLPVIAQSSPRSGNPDAQIRWPLPIYLLQGRVAIRGTANLPNMTGYFVEFQPLNDDGSAQPGNDIWYPAILRSQTPVQDGVLGTWNTALTQDGIYALRLTVSVSNGDPVYDVVAPLRIENHPLEFAGQGEEGASLSTATPSFATATPSPAANTLGSVTVKVISANVRSGDSTSFPVIATLQQADTAEILGQSNRASGWYEVRLSDGRVGWMAPSTLTIHYRDTISDRDIPRFTPPTLDPSILTATAEAHYYATLTATLAGLVPTVPTIPFNGITPTPPATINLVAGLAYISNTTDCPLTLYCTGAQRTTIVCNHPFMIALDVANLGSQQSPGGLVSVTDTRAADGSIQASTSMNFPTLNAGQTLNISTHLNIGTWYNENHTLNFVVDPGNTLYETDETDNTRTLTYLLNQGQCP